MPPLRHKPIRLAPLACDDPPDRVSWTGPDGEEFFPDWGEDLYPALQRNRLDRWAELVAGFEADPDDFHTAWHYLDEHPIHYQFYAPVDGSPVEHERNLEGDQGIERIHFMVVKVNPATLRIDDDEARNTRTQVWWEAGPWLWQSTAPDDDTRRFVGPTGIGQHDLHLGGGADTYEQAIVTLARKVHRRYGNDRRKVSW